MFYTDGISIYDRWGELIFQTKSNIPWDGTYRGKDCQIDIYVYRFYFNDGDKRKVITGVVNLIR